jgi:hypothetical protein
MDEPNSKPKDLVPAKSQQILLSFGSGLTDLTGKTQTIFFNTMDRFVISPKNFLRFVVQVLCLFPVLAGAVVLVCGTYELVCQHAAFACWEWYMWNWAFLWIFAIAQAIALHVFDIKPSRGRISARATMLWSYLVTSLAFDVAALYCHSFDRHTANLDLLFGGTFGAFLFAVPFGFYVQTAGKKDLIDSPQVNERRMCGRAALGFTTAVSGVIMAAKILSTLFLMAFSTGLGALLQHRIIAFLLVVGISSFICFVYYGLVDADFDYGVRNAAKRSNLR